MWKVLDFIWTLKSLSQVNLNVFTFKGDTNLKTWRGATPLWDAQSRRLSWGHFGKCFQHSSFHALWLLPRDALDMSPHVSTQAEREEQECKCGPFSTILNYCCTHQAPVSLTLQMHYSEFQNSELFSIDMAKYRPLLSLVSHLLQPWKSHSYWPNLKTKIHEVDTNSKRTEGFG